MEDGEKLHETQDENKQSRNSSARERIDETIHAFGQWVEALAETIVAMLPTLLSPEVLASLLSRYFLGREVTSSSGLFWGLKLFMKAVAFPTMLSRAMMVAKKVAMAFILIMSIVTAIRFIPVFSAYCSELSWRSDLISENIPPRREAALHFLETTKGEDEQALDVLRALAIADDVESCLHLANYYSLREFEPKGYSQRLDEERAAYWYLQGARGGDSRCQARIGECYLLGYGVMRDVEKAYSWISKSAEAGDEIGLKLMGDCHYMGYGTQPDLDKAIALWTRSRSMGNKEAATSLEKIYE